jgi:hypothetical protein
MRVALAALAVCLVLPVLATPSGAVAAGGSTASAIGSTGMYRPVSRIRAWDSRVSGAIPAKATAKVQVNDVGTSHATDVVAVSVNVTVLTPAVTGSITVFADGTSWSGATMSFQAGQTDQNYETVPVGANGLIDIRNNAARSLALIVDILGYYTRDTGNLGRYQPMTPTRVLDTRTAQPIAAGQTRTFGVGGRAGIPPQGDFAHQIAVAVNFTVLTPSRPGSLTAGWADLHFKTATMTFAAGQTEQGQLLELLDADGGLSVRNNSAAAIQVIADVVGYYISVNITDLAAFDHFSVGTHHRVYDSRAAGKVPPGGTVVLPIWDLTVGETNSGICAPLMNVTVLTPSTGGSVSAWPDGVPRDTAATVTFVAHQTRQRMVMIKVGDSGDVQIRNNSSAPITLIVDVKGWRNCI